MFSNKSVILSNKHFGVKSAEFVHWCPWMYVDDLMEKTCLALYAAIGIPAGVPISVITGNANSGLEVAIN